MNIQMYFFLGLPLIACDICDEQLTFNAMLVFHKLQCHELTRLLTQPSKYYETEDRIQNADNEFEYRIVTKVEIERRKRLKPQIKEEDEMVYATESVQTSSIDYTESNQADGSDCSSSAPTTWPIKCELIPAYPFENEAKERPPKRQFQCVYCKNMYKNRSSIRSHMFYAHRNDVPDELSKSENESTKCRKAGKVGRPSKINETRIFKCKHCDEVFANRSNYNKHVLTLRNGKPFFCRTCIKGFDFRGDLIMHKRQNRDCKSPPREKKYLCTYCGKYFEKKDSLRQHNRVHTRERPFECSQCNRAFVNKGTLKDHMNSHLGLKPYVCQVPECGKAFRLACTLKQHKMNVHEPPTFKCTFCDKMFSDKKHME